MVSRYGRDALPADVGSDAYSSSCSRDHYFRFWREMLRNLAEAFFTGTKELKYAIR